MSEPKWTPGPWRVEAAGFGPPGGWTVSDEANGFGLCTRAPWPNRAEESSANARLIAAAPALYDALAGLVDSGFADPANTGLGYVDNELLNLAVSALAAARGDDA